MTLTDLLHGTRLVLDDLVSPDAMWESADLTRFLNEAQDQFARRTFCFLDSESAFTRLTTVPLQGRYALDPRILSVLSVEDDVFTPLRPAMMIRTSSTASGRPTRYTTRQNAKSLLLWPVPDAVYGLQLLVARRPLEAMEDGDDEPEIPEEWHTALCDWAAYKALTMNDPDNKNLKAGLERRADWEMQVRDAKREYYRFITTESMPAVLRRGV